MLHDRRLPALRGHARPARRARRRSRAGADHRRLHGVATTSPAAPTSNASGATLFSETTFDGVGFGLGVSVAIDPVQAKVPYSVGEFGWGGAASTTFSVDPVLDLTVVFMTQLLPSDTHPIRSQLRTLLHAAIIGA